jgi:histidinol-phosphate aminotransferase
MIRSHISQIEPYQSPDLDAVAERAGMQVEELIRLDANESPFGPAPAVKQALVRFSGYGFYPDYRRLGEAVADYAGVTPQQVVLGNGSDELIDLAIRVSLEPGEGLIICPPAFGMYGFFASLGRHPVYPVPRGSDFSVDVAAIESLLRQQPEGPSPRLLFLTSPGNPDGQIIPLDVVQRLLLLPLLVVVDEAYVEFGETSVTPLLPDHENLIVLRTFSKWASLAGLRLGYALAAPRVADSIERIRAPYNVNSAAVVAALATLDDLEQAKANIECLINERATLTTELAAIPWIEPLPSQANFVLALVHNRTGRELAEALALRGILVRSFSDARLRNHVRIGLGRPEQNQELIDALRNL